MRTLLVAAAGLVMVLGLGVLLLSGPARTNWRKVRTSFKGFVAGPQGELAVISIRNEGPVPLKLRDTFRLDFVGIPPPLPNGLPNLARVLPTYTNLVIEPSAQVDLRISRPELGTSWVAWLEFSPAGPWTEVGEKLIRRQDAVSKKLPMKVGGVLIKGVPIYVVPQPFDDAN